MGIPPWFASKLKLKVALVVPQFLIFAFLKGKKAGRLMNSYDSMVEVFWLLPSSDKSITLDSYVFGEDDFTYIQTIALISSKMNCWQEFWQKANFLFIGQ